MRSCLTLILILIVGSSYAQKNEIGIIPFKRDLHGVTQHRKYVPKFLTSTYYQRNYEKFHWLISVEHGVNSVDDYCETCNDAFQGEGVFKELNLYIGVGKHWNLPLKFGYFQPNIRIKGAAMAYNYSGRYKGGIAYTEFSVNDRYYLLGGELEAGLAFYHQSHIVLRVDCALRRGYTWSRSQWNEGAPSFSEDFRGGSILPKLSIGYAF